MHEKEKHHAIQVNSTYNALVSTGSISRFAVKIQIRRNNLGILGII